MDGSSAVPGQSAPGPVSRGHREQVADGDLAGRGGRGVLPATENLADRSVERQGRPGPAPRRRPATARSWSPTGHRAARPAPNGSDRKHATLRHHHDAVDVRVVRVDRCRADQCDRPVSAGVAGTGDGRGCRSRSASPSASAQWRRSCDAEGAVSRAKTSAAVRGFGIRSRGPAAVSADLVPAARLRGDRRGGCVSRRAGWPGASGAGRGRCGKCANSLSRWNRPPRRRTGLRSFDGAEGASRCWGGMDRETRRMGVPRAECPDRGACGSLGRAYFAAWDDQWIARICAGRGPGQHRARRRPAGASRNVPLDVLAA